MCGVRTEAEETGDNREYSTNIAQPDGDIPVCKKLTLYKRSQTAVFKDPVRPRSKHFSSRL